MVFNGANNPSQVPPPMADLYYWYYYYYYYHYKICIAHKFKHARVGGAGVAGWGNGLAGEGK